jgi:LysR family transcriptional regulator, chromosome initiation inhibitor
MPMKHSFIMLDYPGLAAVASVLREGSFERAADHLGITPSAVSQRVRAIEERLGAILIVRGQPCTGTQLGLDLRAHFDRVQMLEADLAPKLSTGRPGSVAEFPVRVAVNADSLATWFPTAAAAFTEATGLQLDIVVEDETQSAERLRSGEVLAAVTAEAEPVPGCRTVKIGALRYLACASPSFLNRHFAEGVTEVSLSGAHHLRFDRRDQLQARWAREAYGVRLAGPTHWVPSTQGFVDFALTGIGWALHPRIIVEPHLAAGSLVELPPKLPIDVTLYWMITRLQAAPLKSLTDAVRAAADVRLWPH